MRIKFGLSQMFDVLPKYHIICSYFFLISFILAFMQFSSAQPDYRNFSLYDSKDFSLLYPQSLTILNKSGAYSHPNVTGVTIGNGVPATEKIDACNLQPKVQVTVIPNELARIYTDTQLNSFLGEYYSPISQKEKGMYSVLYSQTSLSGIPAREYSYQTDIVCGNNRVSVANTIIYTMHHFRIYAISFTEPMTKIQPDRSEMNSIINSFQIKQEAESLASKVMAGTDNDLASINNANREDIHLIAESVMCHVTSSCGFQMDPQNSSNECDIGSNKTATINTVQGSIILQLLPSIAPCHVANFEKLAQSGLYNGTVFHRIVKGFVIQGGDPLTKNNSNVSLWGTGDAGYLINAEFNDLPHTRGVLSMARASDPNSASSQFFIVLNDSRFLDHEYSAFGKVISGMEVVDKIASLPTKELDLPQDHNLAKINYVTVQNKTQMK